MSPQDKKSLEEIHKLFLELEKTSGDSSFDTVKLKDLKERIQALSLSEIIDVSRLSSLEKHLVADMTLKHFVSFAIPFERALHKTLQDDEFLIVENDKLAGEQEKLPLVFVLDNIRSAFNVGSIFRTAECLGAEKVYLCGYTPLPTQWKVEKTAMGTHEYMDWQEGGKLFECLETLKEEGYQLVALETAASAVDLYEEFPSEPTAFILGNERFGLDPEILKLIDEVRIVPLRGRKNSLNVGVTAAVAGFEWMRQWRARK
ncbi:RNA methyltransferase [Bdellovibrio svalbardensis]|uniref:RNA methyltransferase n=1 Tax=Bdellovibrio svalbardensis TaxID=2972972 RepID=A0ABT6DLD0_9BACT|nr:RNA methyltransferase [Bdellovibrio svalbardensis]MDG0817322.1 RNA methyltransferase [Bdellovibrio svalbardensis]